MGDKFPRRMPFCKSKEVFEAKKMEVCDLQCRGLLNMVVFLPTKIK